MSLTFSNSFLWIPCEQACTPRGMADPAIHYEKEASPERREGQAANWVAQSILYGDASDAHELVGKVAPNGWTVDALMARHINEYVAIVTKHGKPTVERDVSLWGGLVNGRPDGATIDAGETLRVYELKYGWTIVEPQQSTQLALGAMAFLQPHHKLISLEVFQPRPYHPEGAHRKWTLDVPTLRAMEQDYWQAAQRTTAVDARGIPGRYCGFCDKRNSCPSLALTTNSQIEVLSSTLRGKQSEAEPLAREAIMLEDALELLQARLTGIKAEMEARAIKGENFYGWFMEPGRGTRIMTAGPDVVQMMTGLNPWQDRKQKTPNMLEQEGVDKATVAALSTEIPGRMKLARFTSAKAERAFKRAQGKK